MRKQKEKEERIVVFWELMFTDMVLREHTTTLKQQAVEYVNQVLSESLGKGNVSFFFGFLVSSGLTLPQRSAETVWNANGIAQTASGRSSTKDNLCRSRA